MVKLFIGNMPDGYIVQNEDIRPLFEKFGKVGECEVIRNYGFVHVEDDEMADKCIAELNGHMVKGRPLRVEKSESKGPKKPTQKVFIGNIADGTTSEELKALFEPHVDVLEADAVSGKNFGFVHIDSTIGHKKITEIVNELDGHELNDSKIRVQLSTSDQRKKAAMNGDYNSFNFRGRGGGGYMWMGPPARGMRGGPAGMFPPFFPRGGGPFDGARMLPYPAPRGARGGFGPRARRGGGPMRGGRGGGGFGFY